MDSIEKYCFLKQILLILQNVLGTHYVIVLHTATSLTSFQYDFIRLKQNETSDVPMQCSRNFITPLICTYKYTG